MEPIKYLVARYYILFIKDITNPRVLPYHFPSRELAKFNLRALVKGKRNKKGFRIVTGKYLRKYHPKLYKKLPLDPTKYKYPDDKTDYQARKSYRTRMRRRLRRMGILVVGKSTGRIEKSPTRMKVIVNKQKVANTPTSIAKVVQVDGHGTNKYFLILKNIPSDRAGYVCSLFTWCYNTRTKKVYKKTINIRNLDVVTPYLTSELHKLCLLHHMLSPVPLIKPSTKKSGPSVKEL